MNRIAPTLALALLSALPALAQEDPVRALEKRVQETARKVSSAFVFFPGGSGVLISDDGWCLTNHHVIAPPNIGTVERDLPPSVTVILQDAKKREGKIRCSDPVGDIALVKLEPGTGETFPFVTLADSDKVEVGQYVLAIGAPFSIGAQYDPAPDLRHYPSVSLGIVSAMHRYQAQYGDCIQTDAAVNPGNSGGPLVDLDGRLVGINGRILTRYNNRVNSGVGLAIPSNQIRNFLPRMKEGGIDRRIYHGSVTGLGLQEMSGNATGVRVSTVTPRSAADSAGFKTGDVVLSVNGHKVFNSYRFHGIVSTWPAETEVAVAVKRGAETLEIKVKLLAQRAQAITGEMQDPPAAVGGATGATFEEEKDGRVTVAYVKPLSPADDAGLMAGDIVLKINDEKVGSRAVLLDAFQKRRPGESVTLKVSRDGEELDVKIKLGRKQEE